MTTDTRQQPSRQRRLLDELIQERGIRADDYVLFFVSGEGKYLPASTTWADIEETSGYVLDRKGHVFTFWLGWDSQLRRPALVDWEEVQPGPDWVNVPEYQRARCAVGLAPE